MNKRIILMLITSIIATATMYNIFSLNNQTTYIREVNEDVNNINRLYISGVTSINNNIIKFNSGSIDLRNKLLYYNDLKIMLKQVNGFELTKPEYIKYMDGPNKYDIENKGLYILYVEYDDNVLDTIYLRVGD